MRACAADPDPGVSSPPRSGVESMAWSAGTKPCMQHTIFWHFYEQAAHISSWSKHWNGLGSWIRLELWVWVCRENSTHQVFCLLIILYIFGNCFSFIGDLYFIFSSDLRYLKWIKYQQTTCNFYKFENNNHYTHFKIWWLRNTSTY